MSFLTQPITLQSIFGQDRKFGSITVDVVINENTTDVLTITKQPVQQGASITDHAYKEPTVFSTQILFKDGLFTKLSQTYQELQDLQNSREPFDIVTPKRIYKNMLMASLSQTTDKLTENCLAINVAFQEVILVAVVTTSVARALQRIPSVTGAVQAAGKKSALLSLKEGIGALFSR